MATIIYVDLKVEPESLLTYVSEDVGLFDDSLTSNDENLTAFNCLESPIVKDEENDSFEIIDSAENKSEVIGKLLDQIEDIDNLEEFIKDESFSTWFEEKTNLPIFEELQIDSSQSRPAFRLKEEQKSVVFNQYVNQQSQDTSVLLREFETVFDNVELCHNTLTPPQSPPQTIQEPQIIATLQPIGGYVHPGAYYQQILRTANQINENIQPAIPQPDVAHELAEVEELVRTRAENLVYPWEEQKNQPPSSPSSNSCSSTSEYSSDPEWIPETINSPTENIVCASKQLRKRATKPYSRVAPEDKKSRKKEQNKNAASRYRMKKKQEIEEILSEEKDLQDKHDDLDNNVTELQREIKYLKSLMRDLFRAKGLIS